MTLRALLVPLVLAAAPPPALAGAQPGPGARAPGFPSARLEVGRLALDPGFAAAGASDGAGLEAGDPLERSRARRRSRGSEQLLSFVLGVFPGFGLGHAVANAPDWTFWTLLDTALLAVWYFGFWAHPHFLDEDPLRLLATVALVVERLIEGVDAYEAAGGRLFASRERAPPPWAFARPLRDPASAIGR